MTRGQRAQRKVISAQLEAAGLAERKPQRIRLVQRGGGEEIAGLLDAYEQRLGSRTARDGDAVRRERAYCTMISTTRSNTTATTAITVLPTRMGYRQRALLGRRALWS